MDDKDFGYPFGANIKVTKNEDCLQLPWFQDKSLDFVFSSHCLEHFSNPEEIIKEIGRLLKPGGYLVIILPDMRYYPKIGEPGANSDHKWDCYPQVVIEIVYRSASLKIVQLDTLHKRLKNVTLTHRDQRIASAYGHKSLNFSFDVICQKF